MTVPRGRPRSPEADEAIVRATLGVLLDDGYSGLSVEKVAKRAGVGKATIYRRFRDKQELVQAAVAHLHHDLQVPDDTGSFRGDFMALAAQAGADARVTGAPTFIPRMLAEASGHPDVHAIFTRTLVEPRRTVMKTLVERAKQRGEIRTDLDPEVVVDLIAGPMVYRLMLGNIELEELAGHAVALFDTAMAGLAKR